MSWSGENRTQETKEGKTQQISLTVSKTRVQTREKLSQSYSRPQREGWVSKPDRLNAHHRHNNKQSQQREDQVKTERDQKERPRELKRGEEKSWTVFISRSKNGGEAENINLEQKKKTG